MTTSGETEMKMTEVAEYVKSMTGIQRSRATIYNWASKGVEVGGGLVRLATISRAGQLFTDKAKIDEFLAKIDRR